MRDKKSLKILITLIIFLMIGVLVFINYYSLKLSPYFKESQKVQSSFKLFKERNNFDNVILENRYFYDDVYFSASDNDFLYLFNVDGQLASRINKSKLDLSKIQSLAEESFDSYEINYTVIDKEIVYVIVTEKYDIFIDVDNFEEILRFRKGIADE